MPWEGSRSNSTNRPKRHDHDRHHHHHHDERDYDEHGDDSSRVSINTNASKRVIER